MMPGGIIELYSIAEYSILEYGVKKKCDVSDINWSLSNQVKKREAMR